MASRRSRPRRLLLPILLAAALAAEITGIAIARSLAPTAPASQPVAEPPLVAAVGADRSPASADPKRFAADVSRDAVSIAATQTRTQPSGVALAAPAVTLATPARATTTRPSSKTAGSAGTVATGYHGRNHVWIPALGINRSINAFPCSRSRPPDNYLYRWGCAGRNNVYLLGHAHSVFKPLHDAYTGGRLKKGMKVMYADGSGRVKTYAVIWWKVVAPTTAASWAWAGQSRPSMTLQTCVGSKSQSRLMVRLVKVG